MQMKAGAITSEQMYKIEENGHTVIGMKRFLMMENAGHGTSDFLVRRFKNIKGKKVVAVCGTGNNGGDAFVACRHLTGHGAKPTVILLGYPPSIRSEEARLNWGIIERMDSIEMIFGKEINSMIRRRIGTADIILDGIFGTGIRGEIREPYATAIDLVNNSKGYVLAIDVPSGFDPNNGEIHEKVIRADATVTFHRMKTGLAQKNAKKYTGPVFVEKIGIPPEAERGVL